MYSIKKNFKKRETAIDILLNNSKQINSSVYYHKLRIEIKKLNALFRLTEYCAKNFERKRIFKSYKIIFRQAGKVREIQIEEGILNKYFKDIDIASYRSKLQNKKKKEQLKFLELTKNPLIAKRKNLTRETKPFLKKITKKKINCYLKQNRNEIKKILKNNLKQSSLHELRKRIKVHYYIVNTLNHRKKTDTLYKNKTLPNLLGIWHDYQVSIYHLKKAIRTSRMRPEEIISLKKMESKISKKTQDLFNRIKETLQDSILRK